MKIVQVIEVINETSNIKTIRFKWPAESNPGQFIMVWLPGIDEIPMSLSHADGITVDNVGEATRAVQGLKIGSQIGIKGPLGNGFNLAGNNFLLVGGGSGVAALAMAAEELARSGKNLRIAIGASTAGDLLFEERLGVCATVHTATDDGSAGHHGFVTELAEKIIGEERPDMILACGPEPMMTAMVEIAAERKIPIQCSLERYMKCGIGICGSCQLGKYTVCRDGPVFTGQQLSSIDEFGKWKRDASGRQVWF